MAKLMAKLMAMPTAKLMAMPTAASSRQPSASNRPVSSSPRSRGSVTSAAAPENRAIRGGFGKSRDQRRLFFATPGAAAQEGEELGKAFLYRRSSASGTGAAWGRVPSIASMSAKTSARPQLAADSKGVHVWVKSRRSNTSL